MKPRFSCAWLSWEARRPRGTPRSWLPRGTRLSFQVHWQQRQRHFWKREKETVRAWSIEAGNLIYPFPSGSAKSSWGKRGFARLGEPTPRAPLHSGGSPKGSSCCPGDCRRSPPPGLPCTQLTSQALPNELRICMTARLVGRPPGGTRNPLYRPVKRFHYLATTFLHPHMETTEKPWPGHRTKKWSRDFCWTLGS